MKIDLEFVELHSSLFIDGTNFGLKLYSDPKKSKLPIQLYYDTELRHTVVICKNKVSIIESTASKTLTDPIQIGVVFPETPKLIPPMVTIFGEPIIKAQIGGPEKPVRTAQVSSPISQPPKKPGRPAKFQGEESQGE